MKKIFVCALLLVQWLACSKGGDSTPPPPPPPPKPTVTSFTPSSGEEGTTVTISGTNLNVVNGVKFNGTTAIFHLDGSNIQATVPSGAASGTITVKSPNGDASSSGTFTVIAKLPAPVIDSIWPGDNPVTKGVIIFGHHLDSVVKITFGTVEASMDLKLEDTITTRVPDGIAPGQIDLIVTNSHGGADTIPFTVLSGLPDDQPTSDKIAIKSKAKYVPRVTDNWFNEADPAKNYYMHLDSTGVGTGTGTDYLNGDSYPLTLVYDVTALTIDVTIGRGSGVFVKYKGEFVEGSSPDKERIIFYTEDHRQLVFVNKF